MCSNPSYVLKCGGGCLRGGPTWTCPERGPGFSDSRGAFQWLICTPKRQLREAAGGEAIGYGCSAMPSLPHEPGQGASGQRRLEHGADRAGASAGRPDGGLRAALGPDSASSNRPASSVWISIRTSRRPGAGIVRRCGWVRGRPTWRCPVSSASLRYHGRLSTGRSMTSGRRLRRCSTAQRAWERRACPR